MKVKECIGCGFCCLKGMCQAGARLYSGATVCPALEWTGERHECKLMNLPGDLGAQYRKELYAGAGCCGTLNSWRHEPLENRIPPPKPVYSNPIPPIMQKFIKSLGGQFMSGDVLTLTLYSFKSSLIRDGMDEDEALNICQEIIHQMKGNRHSFADSFFGELQEIP